MDFVALLRELSDSGVSEIVIAGVTLVVVRYWILQSASGLRAEINQKAKEARDHTDAKFNEARDHTDAKFNEARDHTDAKFNEARDHTDAKFNEMRAYVDMRFGELRIHSDTNTSELRQEMNAGDNSLRQELRAYAAASEERHKEIMLHLMDVRERLANMEGRMGITTYRQSLVPPPELPQPESIGDSPESEVVS